MSSAKPNLSLSEKIDLTFRLLLAPLVLFVSITAGLPRASKCKVLLRFWIRAAFFRYALGHLAPRHIQFLVPATLETYTTWVQNMQADQARRALKSEQRLKCNVVSLPGEASLLWVGDPSRATKFVLFFHGGGYMAPLGPGHLNWCWRAYARKSEENHHGGITNNQNVAVAVLQYSLAPGAQCPTQLRQAAAALNYLLGEGVDPRNMIFGGDSAGGNLSAQLLRHLLSPVRGVETVCLGGRRLAGIFMVSPWLSGATDMVSFRDNGEVDMLSASIVKDSDANALTPGLGAEMALPLDGDLSWLPGIESAAESLYITCGHQEVFRDHVLAFSEAVRVRNKGLELKLDVAACEVHDAILLEGSIGVVGDATLRMRRWASARLQGEELG